MKTTMLVTALFALVCALLAGHDALDWRLPSGLLVSNLVLAAIFGLPGWIALTLSPPKTYRRWVSLCMLVLGLSWLPGSAALAGNLALNFSSAQGYEGLFWIEFTAIVAGLVFIWMLIATVLHFALRQRTDAREM